jgi:hypothetical protein
MTTTFDNPPPAESTSDTASGMPAGVDLDELAERVYRRWLDELRRERERSGTQW